MTRALTTEQFIIRARSIHEDQYDYSTVTYTTSHERVCIICSYHGMFLQRPNTHLSGSGCPECALNHFPVLNKTHRDCRSSRHIGDRSIDVDQFYKSPQTFDGLSHVCKRCHQLSAFVHKASALIRQKRHYEKHKARIIERMKNNPKKPIYDKTHRQKYPHVVASNAARRRVAKIQATPQWAITEKCEIEALYKECKRIMKITGIQHEVDHIVPLLAVEACGLHCLSNLRIVTKHENASRKNQLDE